MIAPIRTKAASGSKSKIKGKPLWVCGVRRGVDDAGFCVVGGAGELAGCGVEAGGVVAGGVVAGGVVAAVADGEVGAAVVGTGVVPVGLSGNC